MTNQVGEMAKSLIDELKTTGTVNGLRGFLRDSKADLLMTFDDSELENLKNIGMLYFVMLQDDNFEDDPDERQLIAALGYYVLSLGVQKTSDKIGIPTKPLDWIEFLKLRILLSLHSKASIMYSLAMRPDKEVDKYWSPLSDNPYRKEQEALTNMILTDAAEIKRWSESDLVAGMANTFKNEAINLANQILDNNQRVIQNSTLEKVLYEGKDVHKSLFNFFYYKFNNRESVNATQFVDE